MKLRQLEYLLAIVDNGLNITAAAERLYTSQPGVSKQIRLLEDELGFTLFARKGKALGSLTAEGSQVVDRARRVLQEVQHIRSLSDEIYHQKRGALHIGTTHTQARYVLPEVINAFRQQYPNVSLNLHQGTSEQIADMVTEKQVDFAIATGAHSLFPSLVMLPCYRWDRSIIVPADHELAQDDEPLTLERLAQFPLVTYVFSFSGESSLKRAFTDRGLVPEVVFTARDADVIKTYVKMGMGVGIIASMAQDCEESGLKALEIPGLFPRSTTWIGFRRDTVLTKFMYDFIEGFAPHLDQDRVREAVQLPEQSDIESLFEGTTLPLKGRCAEDVAEAEYAATQ
ncbi:MAG: HTH-type transcriptional regulator CysB [Pseudomonadota bacterium]